MIATKLNDLRKALIKESERESVRRTPNIDRMRMLARAIRIIDKIIVKLT